MKKNKPISARSFLIAILSTIVFIFGMNILNHIIGYQKGMLGKNALVIFAWFITVFSIAAIISRRKI